MDALQVGTFDWDLPAGQVSLSRKLAALWGFEPGEFDGTQAAFVERVHPADRTKLEAELTRCLAAREGSALELELELELRVTWPDGGLHCLEMRGELSFSPCGQAAKLTGAVLDIDSTSLRQRDDEIERLTTLYQALSSVNQAVVGTRTRPELFETICRTLTRQGGFSLAWVGTLVAEKGEVAPVAVSGANITDLGAVKIDQLDSPETQGPFARAFLQGHPHVSNDTFADSAGLPGRTELHGGGFRSLAGFPIREMGSLIGLLCVQDTKAGAFGPREMALLGETADDISFALDSFAHDEQRLQAEQQMRRERDFSNAVLESLPGILYLYDESGQFLRWNNNFETVSGYSASEIEAMRPLDFFTGDDNKQAAQRIADVFATGSSNLEATFTRKDGKGIPYHFTGVKTEIDGKACLIGVGIDTSERHQAEAARKASESLYRTLFDYAPDGILIADSRSAYRDANPSACRMLGYSREELIGFNASDILAEGELSRVAEALETITSGQDFHQEWFFRRKDGSVFAAEVLATVMPDGDLLAMIRDITERKEAESALRDLNDTLEVKVAARTEELRAVLIRAEAADRVKSSFLATMSHELRTPLNSIIGFTSIILQGLAGPLTPEQSKQLGMVKGSSKHLLELINDVLDLSKIEAEQLEVRAEAFDLKASIERVIASVRPQVEKKSLLLTAVVAPGLSEMVSDRRRVEQILLNLISNALKFTDSGSITVDAELLENFRTAESDRLVQALRLRVSDTGIGVKPEDLAALFHPFRQLDTGLTRRHEGTGLGLAICRSLATLMGGEITAASRWQVGSEFTLTLPLRRAVPS